MKRLSLCVAVAVLSSLTWAQTFVGIPNPGTVNTYTEGTNTAGCSAGTPTCLKVYAGNTASGAGAPGGNLASFMSYRTNAGSFTPNLVSPNEPQGGWDIVLAAGLTAPSPTVPGCVFFTGGGDRAMAKNTQWLLYTTFPAPITVVTDPTVDGGPAGSGCTWVAPSYEVAMEAVVSAGHAVSIGDSTVTVNQLNAARAWLANADASQHPLLTIEGETVTVTSQSGSAPNFVASVSPNFASAHAAGREVYISDSGGNQTALAKTYDSVAVMDAIVCNGISNPKDIRIYGESNGGEIVANLALMGLADKLFYADTVDYPLGTCPNRDSWMVTRAEGVEPPDDQRSTALLSNDSTSPQDSALQYGFGYSGAINDNTVGKSLWDTSTTATNVQIAALGACTAHDGFASGGSNTFTAVANHAHSQSPQGNLPASAPGGFLHPLAFPPIMYLSVGNDDGDIDGAQLPWSATRSQTACFATSSGSSLLVTSRCGSSSCPHGTEMFLNLALANIGTWFAGSDTFSNIVKDFNMPDPIYGVWNASTSGGGGTNAAF